VLALGGPVGFVPATSEWMDRARPHLRDEPEQARRILDDLRKERPDSPGLWYGEAMLAAAQGDLVAAQDWLDAAVKAEPLLLGEAEREPLLASIRPTPGAGGNLRVD
jgi:predicted Zn-dependent protease